MLSNYFFYLEPNPVEPRMEGRSREGRRIDQEKIIVLFRVFVFSFIFYFVFFSFLLLYCIRRGATWFMRFCSFMTVRGCPEGPKDQGRGVLCI